MEETTKDQVVQQKEPISQVQAIHDKKAALNAIKNKFISTTIKMYINSIGREVNFREITVAEQKKLARIMIVIDTLETAQRPPKFFVRFLTFKIVFMQISPFAYQITF